MLWVFLGVSMLASMFAVVMPSDALNAYLATGQFEGETIDATMLAVMIGLFCLLPLAMAFVTLVLRDPINRYVNAIMGGLATVMWAWDLIGHAGKEVEIGALLMVAMIGAGLLIVWHAWKWPKPAVQDLPDRRPVTGPDLGAAKPV
jgi:hypothetical protein